MQNIEHIIKLHKNESLMLKLRQSYLSSISPDTVVLTDRRVIIIHNSFWGLYFGHNILSPTRASTVMLTNIMGTTTATGKILSTVNIRIRGSSGDTESPASGWHIDGIRIGKAMKLTEMIEEMVESDEELDRPQEIDVIAAKELLRGKECSVIWLGVEPPDYVAYMFSVDPIKVTRINPADIFSMSEEGLKSMAGDVFACYNGHISSEVAALLKKEYGISAYALRGGLIGLINSRNKEKDNNV